MIKYIIITPFQIQRGVQFKYVAYKMGQTQNSCGFRQAYSLYLHMDRGLVANRSNRPDLVMILDVRTMTSHSQNIDRANSTGGTVAWLLK